MNMNKLFIRKTSAHLLNNSWCHIPFKWIDLNVELLQHTKMDSIEYVLNSRNGRNHPIFNYSLAHLCWCCMISISSHRLTPYFFAMTERPNTDVMWTCSNHDMCGIFSQILHSTKPIVIAQRLEYYLHLFALVRHGCLTVRCVCVLYAGTQKIDDKYYPILASIVYMCKHFSPLLTEEDWTME